MATELRQERIGHPQGDALSGVVVMKKSYVVLILIACFVGVFGALQMDRWINGREAPVVMLGPAAGRVMGVSTETEVAVAAPTDFRQAARRVMTSVVSVDQFRRIGRDMDGTVQLGQAGSGSGVILSTDGVIVTNNHVVARAAQVRVRLQDGRTFPAEILGRDERSDLAILKINAPNLTPIVMGDSEQVEVGEWVIAVGNPLGYANTVSVGVVSSLQRNLQAPGGTFLLDAIQTDAAINPGNSGGALATADGRLVGINSAIISTGGGSIGIGFAIPVNRVKRVLADILQHGYVRYAGLGIQYSPLSDVLLQDPGTRREIGQITGGNNVPERGILLFTPRHAGPPISPGSPAAQAGMREFDVLLEIDGTPIDSTMTLNQVLDRKRPGDRVTVAFWSRGQVHRREVVLQEIRQPQ
jgi:S1-C subfamily serine protease